MIPALSIGILLLAAGQTEASASVTSTRLVVMLEGLQSNKGQVVVALYDNAKSMKAKTPLVHGTLRIEDRKAVFEVASLAPGRYAVAAFHDEDADGKLGTNFLGIPNEGVGTSNNPKTFGPPGFEDAAFDLKAPETRLTVRMNYL